MLTIEKLKEELVNLEIEEINIEKRIKSLEDIYIRLRKKTGIILKIDDVDVFVNLDREVYRLTIDKNTHKYNLQLLKKKIKQEIKKQIEEIEVIPEVLINHGKIESTVVLDETYNELKEKENLLKEIQEKITNLKKEIRRRRKEINDKKRKLLRNKNYKCDSCSKEVKKIDYVVLDKELVLCNECWKKPEYIYHFKDEIEFSLLPRYFNLSFSDMKNLEKVMKLGIIEGYEWGNPIKAVHLSRLKEAIEEGKNYYFTKELAEKLSELGLKKNWIYEMEKDGVIQPAGIIEIELKRNKSIDAKLWDIRKINEEDIKRWIEKKEKEKAINKVIAREKIRNSLREVHSYIRKKREEKEEIIKLLKSYHPFLEIAFYLYHLNHYAKTPKYENYKNKLYRLKKEALLKAYKEYKNLFRILFIERGNKVKLCDVCFEKARRRWYYEGGYETGLTLGEWINLYAKTCEYCDVKEDYYSLIEFEIDTSVSRFIFHLPYPEIKNFLDKFRIPKTNYKEEEYFIKYGRQLEKYEALIVPLKEVIKSIENYLSLDIKEKFF